MKIETANRYAVEIARRVREVNGLIPTPDCQHAFVKINKMWIFGSTVKGSCAPQDLDLLIDLEMDGKSRSWEDVGYDIRYYRSYGIRVAKDSRAAALKWLTKGMRNVSRHCRDEELTVFDVQVEVYPNFELQL